MNEAVLYRLPGTHWAGFRPMGVSAARGLALFIGGFSLLNVLGELRYPGFDANLWWIDLRPLGKGFSAGMRRMALRLGVPDADILIDQQGLNTQATVRNTCTLFAAQGIDRVLAVSHFYHLPRIKLAYQRQGWEVCTVPARESYPLTALPLYMVREVPALWLYYLSPLWLDSHATAGTIEDEPLQNRNQPVPYGMNMPTRAVSNSASRFKEGTADEQKDSGALSGGDWHGECALCVARHSLLAGGAPRLQLRGMCRPSIP